MTKSIEDLKKNFQSLTDEQLKEEYRYRTNYSTRMLGIEMIDLVIKTRMAVTELMKERGLL